jgi:hypothetical protein
VPFHFFDRLEKQMIIGIVGSEAAKFTKLTEPAARLAIRRLFLPEVSLVVSGGCYLGGIDVWSIEEAIIAGKPYKEFPAKERRWSGPSGYESRNVKIAEICDKLICIAVRELPPGYRGMRFDWCYHCRTGAHVKSGGCWTMKKAAKLGKLTELIVI